MQIKRVINSSIYLSMYLSIYLSRDDLLEAAPRGPLGERPQGPPLLPGYMPDRPKGRRK